MNNYETEFVNLMKDLLLNRPKDNNEKPTKYNSSDREKTLKIIETSLTKIENNRSMFSTSEYHTLLEAYGVLKTVLELGLV